MGEKSIVRSPEIDQKIPINFGEILQIDERVLFVARKGKAALQRGSDKALMIVGSRVKQVAKDFLLGPLPLSRTHRCVGVIELRQQRFGLGHGAAKVGGDGRKWVHGATLAKL